MPVVRAWLHEGGRLKPISLSSNSHALGHAPNLMMVHYGKQYYLQPVEWEGKGVWLEMESKTAGRVEKPARDEETVFNVRSHWNSKGARRNLCLCTCRCSPDTTPFARTWLLPHLLTAWRRKVNPVLCSTMIRTLSPRCVQKALMVCYCLEKGHKFINRVLSGLAVYFYADLLPRTDYKALEENNSDSSQTVCSLPSDSIPYQTPGWKQWLVPRLFSIVKYLLFGAFVLVCNKLRRSIRAQRHRNSSSSSSTSSSADIVDVS